MIEVKVMNYKRANNDTRIVVTQDFGQWYIIDIGVQQYHLLLTEVNHLMSELSKLTKRKNVIMIRSGKNKSYLSQFEANDLWDKLRGAVKMVGLER